MSGLPMSSSRREQHQAKLAATAMAAIASGQSDDDAARKAVMAVVQVWLDRLQLVSVITSFFASIDCTLLSFTSALAHIGSSDVSSWTNTVQVMNASLAGALIFHVCAGANRLEARANKDAHYLQFLPAIASFVGSFVLIRYRLIDAKDHVPRVPTQPSTPMPPNAEIRPDPPRFLSSPPLDKPSHSQSSEHTSFMQPPFLQPAHIMNLFTMWQTWSDTVTDLQGRVFIHQVQLFHWFRSPNNGTNLDPPIKLLSNCHSLSVTMTVIGFILALLGILTFVWTSLPVNVGVFASVCLGTCLTAITLTFSLS